MTEREMPAFSGEERAEMATLARDIAECGQDAIDQLTQTKARLAIGSLKVIDGVDRIEDKLLVGSNLLHDVRVINEVLRQAKAIRQLQGVDDLSQLDRHAQEAGLGSIFDENSAIGAKLKQYLR